MFSAHALSAKEYHSILKFHVLHSEETLGKTCSIYCTPCNHNTEVRVSLLHNLQHILNLKDYVCYLIQLIKQNQPTSGVFHLVAGAVCAFHTLLCSATSYSIHPQFWLLCCRSLL